MAGACEVGVVGVDGEQDWIRLDAGVEAIDQALEVGHPADTLVQGPLAHGRIVRTAMVSGARTTPSRCSYGVARAA